MSYEPCCIIVVSFDPQLKVIATKFYLFSLDLKKNISNYFTLMIFVFEIPNYSTKD